MKQEPKRLAPRPETLRQLFLKSGNLCAFPNCLSLMMNEKGVFIGQVCHIEAAEPGGPRFNPNMDNEDRRHADNLMLMCYEHRKVTDDTKKYTVKKLRKIKNDHESRFSAPGLAILERLTDWTTEDMPGEVTNLWTLNGVLDLYLDTWELDDNVEELNEYIELFRRAPIEVRRFVGAVAERAYRMPGTSNVDSDLSSTSVPISDIKDALRIGDTAIKKKLAQLESYGLGDLGEIKSPTGVQYTVNIRKLRSGWAPWMEIVAFCKTTKTPIERFTEDLEFSRLDN